MEPRPVSGWGAALRTVLAGIPVVNRPFLVTRLRVPRALKMFYRYSRNRGGLRPSLIEAGQEPENRPGTLMRNVARKTYILSPWIRA
ncbi:hypothetical protein Memar_0793 [Methanoculleus marisnigri JR1]|uniref:Uncharacterized protein n=1 Tax=Methanoculleus marisnigri (strain ATCC 35101 / DSM 1498 / JR1) TaxID=368407 RepID=A3CTM6_METMJ|nr:hypothetical protein Memar_0793 [Methanoculleus marisnigri JR1]